MAKIKVKFDKEFKYAHRGVEVVTYGPGVEEVSLDVAERALECGRLNDASENKVRKALGLKVESDATPEERKAKTLSVLEKMDQADPERKDEASWTNTGLPEVKAINAALEESKAGFTVNAKERDTAWSEYEKTKEPTE